MTAGVRGEIAAKVTGTSGDRRTVYVRALSYNVPDTYQTSWKPGVLTADIRSKLASGGTIPVCWQHDRKRIVGKVVDYSDGPGALDLQIRLADPAHVPDARMVQSLLEDGMLPGVSIGFDAGQSEPDPVNRGVRRFTRAALVELSFVTVPSVPGAKVLAMRSVPGTTFDLSRFTEDERDLVEEYVEMYEAGEITARQVTDVCYAIEQGIRDRDVEVALAKLTLRGFHQRATAGVRARVELRHRTGERATAEREERLRKSRALYAHDTTPPDPHFIENYFGAKSWRVDPNDAVPDFPPAESVRAALDAGVFRTEAEAVAAWRARYGKTDQTRGPDAPNAQGVPPYPPQDLIDARLAAGVHPAQTIADWRKHYGFEEPA